MKNTNFPQFKRITFESDVKTFFMLAMDQVI